MPSGLISEEGPKTAKDDIRKKGVTPPPVKT
jgi:hypothetical protein